MYPVSNMRSQGVRIPENQSTEAAPTMKVTNVAVMKPLLIEWGNERGQKETSIAFVIGGKVYVPPQYKIWTEGFRPLIEEIGKQVIAALETQDASKSPVVPSEDTVDVVSVTGAPQTANGALVDVFEKPKAK